MVQQLGPEIEVQPHPEASKTQTTESEKSPLENWRRGWGDSRFAYSLVGSFVLGLILHFQGGDLAKAGFDKLVPIVSTSLAIVFIRNNRWWAFQFLVQATAAYYLVKAVIDLILP